jgi:hypothetical protein
MKNRKDVVCGLGEIGLPILRLLSKSQVVVGYDTNSKLMNKTNFDRFKNLDTAFLHICIPFSKKFQYNIKRLYNQFSPSCIVIHSTVSPYTTQKIQSNLDIPIIYSSTRGVHKRMQRDLKRYTKFFAIEKNAPRAKWAIAQFNKLMKNCGVKTKKMSDPLTLELAKIIVDTSYYGWLINYAQLSKMIADKHKINYDEMWSFSDEIHKFLGNRPKMFPGFIGGHCVIPNLSLIDEKSLWSIDKLNNSFAKKVNHT